MGLAHVAGCTGRTSEGAVQRLHGLPGEAMIDMGDFAGGLLKYVRRHPVPRLTIGGGFAKMSKLADGSLDLHSGRSQVDPARLSERAAGCGADAPLQGRIRAAGTAGEALALAERAGVGLAGAVAAAARETALGWCGGRRRSRSSSSIGAVGSLPARSLKPIPCSRQSVNRAVEAARAGMTKGVFPSGGGRVRAASALLSGGAADKERPCAQP